MYPACIITYNADLLRLNENINAIRSQVAEVIIFDNGSGNVVEIESKFGSLCTILKSANNLGVATALNEVCRFCHAKGYEWVLTLDDDSVCPPNLLGEYEKFIDDTSVGIISPRILDRNIGDIDYYSLKEADQIDACITSASLLNLKAWRDVGGFWDDLFIDMVDFDICWSLREKGYKVLRVNSVSLLHELGHSTLAIFRGKKVAVLNHSPQRYYYIFRNTILVGRKHHRRLQCLRWNLKRLWLIIRYENNSFSKINAALKGSIDGCKYTNI